MASVATAAPSPIQAGQPQLSQQDDCEYEIIPSTDQYIPLMLSPQTYNESEASPRYFLAGLAFFISISQALVYSFVFYELQFSCAMAEQWDWDMRLGAILAVLYSCALVHRHWEEWKLLVILLEATDESPSMMNSIKDATARASKRLSRRMSLQLHSETVAGSGTELECGNIIVPAVIPPGKGADKDEIAQQRTAWFKGSCAENFHFFPFACVLASFYVFTLVIARSESLVDLISNFVGMTIISEADNIIAQALRVRVRLTTSITREKLGICPRPQLPEDAIRKGVRRIGIYALLMYTLMWMIWNTGCKIPESARYLMDEGLVSDNFELTAIGLAMSTGTLSPAALNGSASYTYLNMTEVDFSDSLVATVELGMTFTFYNQRHRSIIVDPKGLLRFPADEQSIIPDEANWPSLYVDGPRPGSFMTEATATGAGIAVFWTDALRIDEGGRILAGPIGDSSFAVIYDNVPIASYAGLGTLTAEIILDSCGRVTLTYFEASTPGSVKNRIFIGLQSGDRATNEDAGIILYAGGDTSINPYSSVAIMDGWLNDSLFVFTPPEPAFSVCDELPESSLHSLSLTSSPYEPRSTSYKGFTW